MTKAKYAPSSRRSRKKILKKVKGQWGARSKLIRVAKIAVRKALIANYADRKKKKRNFRALWISRISAACKQEGISYSKFMGGLKKTGISLNRKVLANLAFGDSKAFAALVKKAGK